MENLYETSKLNAEGYCRKCGASLGIGGDCVICAVERFERRGKLPNRTMIILNHETPSTSVKVHRARRAKVQNYQTHLLTLSSARRLRRVIQLPIWDHVIEFDDDELSHTVYLHAEKPVVKS